MTFVLGPVDDRRACVTTPRGIKGVVNASQEAMTVMGWYGGMGGGFGGGGWLVMTVLVLLLIAAGVAVSRITGRGSQAPDNTPPDARQLLDETFARGGLTEEEYLRRRELLRGR